MTTAHHQVGIDSVEDGLWAWFDLCILKNSDANQPKVVDGRELIWSSHEIPYDHDEYTGQAGELFTREHELLSYLEVRY
jgi:hypothetical protein